MGGFSQLLAVTSTQRQSFSSGLCLYSPKWKMIGPSIYRQLITPDEISNDNFSPLALGKSFFFLKCFPFLKTS
jgi:hypothetical protein